jgi:arylsulfatase A-like enzyme
MTRSAKSDRPNIVLVLMDNLGYGELGVYGGGILRGAPTPRIDALAAEGLRLLNFNVEAQCTPTRAALLTGRYPIRGGNGSVPFMSPVYGLMRSEYSLARMLSDAGYATGIFGKWHLGQTVGRFPTDHGFDEWFGIPNSSDESLWPDNDMLHLEDHPGLEYEHVMESVKGEVPRKLRIYDLEARTRIDREITDRAIDFMARRAAGRAPFFAYVPYTQTHYPVLPHPDFLGKTRNGRWADTLAQIDAYTGELIDAVERLGIRDRTLFIFTSDNGPEMNPQWAGSSGPWRGTYFSGLEGSLRVPFIVRWPGHVPAGSVSNEIVHVMDIYPTLARIAGAKLPTDRPIDGADQLDFLTFAQPKSNREGFVVYVGNEIFGVKWRDWKMMFKEASNGYSPVQTFNVPRIFNLLADPKEEHHDVYRTQNLWVMKRAARILDEHRRSLQECPPVAPGTPDPDIVLR